jgi:hypothetical protein
MSIPIRFDWYSVDGQLLVANRGCYTISYGQEPGDLNLLASRLQEGSIDLHRRFIHQDVRYAVPHSAPDYMFDLQDPSAILPNRFKVKS